MAATELIPTPDLTAPVRKASEWTSPKGMDTESVPWRLWEKAKKFHWDPADIDFSNEARDWALLDEEQQLQVAALARGFMIGEESVTLDILPLLVALSDEGRLEEVMYLTTFAYEEAKHCDFFRRWFDAVGVNMDDLDEKLRQQAIDNGDEPADPERNVGMFESVLPETMRACITDPGPWSQLNAADTNNQIVEGCLALSGYKVWAEMFEMFGVMPALQEGLRLIRRDEGRHITYGTWLAQRLLATNPELLPQARARMHELRDMYYETDLTPAEEPDPANPLDQFTILVDDQMEKRIAILERAAEMSEEEVLTEGEHSAEALERELVGAE